MKIVLVYASQLEDSKSIQDRYGKYCIVNSERFNEITCLGSYNNSRSLASVYNAFINEEEYITVLAHDDLLIRDKNWIEKLKNALDAYDVIGLAGGSEAKITPPCLWHLMCPSSTHRGCVSHVNEDRKGTFVTNFGKQGRVLLLDGLFLAFKTKRLFEAGVRFDETNPAKFHFYDIDFCMTCNSKKLKLGTVNIDAVHNSHGLRKYTEEWKAGQAWFMQKFSDGKYNF
jgi:hypothetical protein